MGCGSAGPCGRRWSRMTAGPQRPRTAGRLGSERGLTPRQRPWRTPRLIPGCLSSREEAGSCRACTCGLSAGRRVTAQPPGPLAPGPVALSLRDARGAARGARRTASAPAFLAASSERAASRGDVWTVSVRVQPCTFSQ